MEYQRQASEDFVIEEKREAVQIHLDRAPVSCKEHSTATLELEEAERGERTQAQNRESRSIANSPRVDPVQELVK